MSHLLWKRLQFRFLIPGWKSKLANMLSKRFPHKRRDLLKALHKVRTCHTIARPSRHARTIVQHFTPR